MSNKKPYVTSPEIRQRISDGLRRAHRNGLSSACKKAIGESVSAALKGKPQSSAHVQARIKSRSGKTWLEKVLAPLQ